MASWDARRRRLAMIDFDIETVLAQVRAVLGSEGTVTRVERLAGRPGAVQCFD